jgi:penicillin-binding protein 1A
MVWNKYMTFAHKGIDLKPIPYVESEDPKSEDIVASADAAAADGLTGDGDGPGTLSTATTERLLALEKLMRDARPLRPYAGLWPPSPVGLTGVSPAARPAATAPSGPPGPPLVPDIQ